MSTHHVFSPSRLHRLALCPSSWRVAAGQPDEASPEASEGAMLHAQVVEAIHGRPLSPDHTAEQCELVAACAGHVAASVAAGYQVETEVPLRLLDDFEVMTAGTADVILRKDGEPLREPLRLLDWKFGRSPVAAPESNWQLMAYAVMAAQRYDVENVKLAVFQPRVSRSLEWRAFDAGELDRAHLRIRAAVQRAGAEAWTLLPGDEQCRYCPGRAVCPAARERLEIVPAATLPLDRPDVLGALLDRARTVKQQAAAIEEAIRDHLVKGGAVAGYMLRTTKGKRKVEDANLAFERMQAHVSRDAFLRCVSVSVADLEDLYARSRKEKDGVTLKAAKQEFSETMDGVVTYGEPVLKVEKA